MSQSFHTHSQATHLASVRKRVHTALRREVSVSYTHLDVYKRQEFAMAPISAAVAAMGAGLLNMIENPNTPKKLIISLRICLLYTSKSSPHEAYLLPCQA